LENSEDCGSAGGHGNQHVRLRGASIDTRRNGLPGSGNSLLPRVGQTARSKLYGPQKILYCLRQEQDMDPAEGDAKHLQRGRRKAIRSRFFSVQSAFKAFPRLAAGPGIVLGYVLGRLPGLAGSTP
jgi:hypothetical protein